MEVGWGSGSGLLAKENPDLGGSPGLEEVLGAGWGLSQQVSKSHSFGSCQWRGPDLTSPAIFTSGHPWPESAGSFCCPWSPLSSAATVSSEECPPGSDCFVLRDESVLCACFRQPFWEIKFRLGAGGWGERSCRPVGPMQLVLCRRPETGRLPRCSFHPLGTFWNSILFQDPHEQLNQQLAQPG